jgi:hypothetical protein
MTRCISVIVFATLLACGKKSDPQSGVCSVAQRCPSLVTAVARLRFDSSCITSQLSTGQTNTCFANGTRIESQPLGESYEVRLFGPGDTVPVLIANFSGRGSSVLDGATGTALMRLSSSNPDTIQLDCDGQTFFMTSSDLKACGPTAGSAHQCTVGSCP